jgi:hypothetical protein
MKEPRTRHHELKTHSAMSAGQLQAFARFLETHPGFYPELKEENAAISGFRVGGCLLNVDEMSEFISAQPPFSLHENTPPVTEQPTSANRKLP